jgi:hypothetical protein
VISLFLYHAWHFKIMPRRQKVHHKHWVLLVAAAHAVEELQQNGLRGFDAPLLNLRVTNLE